MSSNRNLYEVFALFENAPTTEEKKQVLRNNNSHALRSILRANFHPRIRFVFDQVPAYRPLEVPPGLGYTSLDQEVSRLYLFEQGNPRVPNELTQKRKEQLLVQVLESLEAKEAVVLASTVMKNLSVPGLTKELAMEVFTDIEN